MVKILWIETKYVVNQLNILLKITSPLQKKAIFSILVFVFYDLMIFTSGVN